MKVFIVIHRSENGCFNAGIRNFQYVFKDKKKAENCLLAIQIQFEAMFGKDAQAMDLSLIEEEIHTKFIYPIWDEV